MSVTFITVVILILHSHRQVSVALTQAENWRHEMEEAIGHLDYLMGVTRERFRPVHAMAHWARALRHDPQNAASAWLPDYAEQRLRMKVDAAIALHHPADEPRWGIPAPTISVDRRPAIHHEQSSA